MQRSSKFPSIFKSLYTHNPFYLLSTCFVLYAIKRAFRPELMGYIDPWALMASLTGFTMLAAVTAWVVVRFGKVWEDARSIVLVLVLMFLAMSVSFDELLNLYSTEAIGLLTFGFCFSVIVTEALLRSLKIRFPILFRMPFYMMLALFFFYPMFVSHEVTGLGLTATRWRIALFPTIAAAISLFLIFAVRRGTAYVSPNGTPWRWPWFPWTLFVFLAFAVCGRSYSLSISFDTSVGHVIEMNSLFGGYFLIPFFLAILVLLLEIGIIEDKRGLRTGVMAAAGLLLLLALPLRGFDPTFAEFQTTFVRALASPLFLSLMGLLAFYLYAWLRGIRVAEAGVVATLLLAIVVGPKTLGISTLTAPVFWPLAALAAMQLVLAIGRRRSVHAFVSALCATAVFTALMWQPELLMYRRVVPYHLLLLATIGIGVIFSDRFSGTLSSLGAVALPPTCVVTALSMQTVGVAESAMLVYLIGMTGLALVHWYFTSDRWYLAAGLLNVAGGSGGISWMAFRQFRDQVGAEVIQPLLYGTACFLLAALISAHKAGAFNGFLFGTKSRNLNDPD
ncbi:MAG: hypothetical protein HON53_07595 [Planctomycetaceae bacterium]|jgi:hypothetical protein|nr:hypothetical protein [Planctomycetaceae bacterium]MBT6156348.1 hypothetical protein [Planctomycetaceae bacterium]MBT6483880.1 hypothetical protein [Planctomycetaceae bacterium]MBT6496095.1 hypothetical protein [Planctomycetaceae bacterium]